MSVWHNVTQLSIYHLIIYYLVAYGYTDLVKHSKKQFYAISGDYQNIIESTVLLNRK